MAAMPRRLSDPELLTDPAALAGLLGPVAAVRRSRLEAGASLTGNRLERVEARLASGATRQLVLKRIRPAESWIARRTGDAAGREARLLDEPALAPCWEVFDCPYLAYAQTAGEVGLLMDDLSDGLAPAGPASLDRASEERLVAALAVLAGATLLLWQKALPLADPSPPPAAVAEWEWWLAALERWW
jgi:hypothetical protein